MSFVIMLCIIATLAKPTPRTQRTMYYILPCESHTTADGVHIQESFEMSPDPLPRMYSKESTITVYN